MSIWRILGLGVLVAATMLICYGTTMILFPAVLKFLTVKD